MAKVVELIELFDLRLVARWVARTVKEIETVRGGEAKMRLLGQRPNARRTKGGS